MQVATEKNVYLDVSTYKDKHTQSNAISKAVVM